MKNKPAFWAVVPAAGTGRRMGASTPKQFLALGQRTVLEHSLESLWNAMVLDGLVLVSHGHPALASLMERHYEQNLIRADGGRKRCHSVLNGLNALSDSALADDWILVHDAARPCVRQQDLCLLIDTLADHPVGGLLGIPVHDTMKKTDAEGVVIATVERNALWHACTPQMFRYGLLQAALHKAIEDGYEVTDESSAMEHAGHRPLMIEGHADNIKITRPEDLPLAEYYLQQQGRL
ncbi:MAG: 2-C-methyl-D-erythritol 4-phosphate cytidylyltransferase [Gammaproteobacteria bacterium]|nr:MAG: 2-C-methyl-D-erythritol 4-phosphate cytidylyltransferase [Gammaproteobacteria bacterium]